MSTYRKHMSETTVLILLGLSLMLSIALSFLLGRYAVPLKELFYILIKDIFPVKPFWDDTMEKVVYNIRLPRILLACLVGCCLSAAGASYQGVFQNPMAAPDILGATSGAAFGASLAILLGADSHIITVSAFCFSLIAVGLVFLVSRCAKGKKVLTLVLAGIMIHSLFYAGTSFIKLIADPSDELRAITYWLMGSLSGTKNKTLSFVILPMLVGLIPLFLLRWRMNILTLGDDEAKAMGVNAGLIRFVVIVCSTLITAASVSVTGMIGWVGLVIPHLARRLVGNNYKHLIPASMLFGAIFLLWVDNVARNMLATEVPIGILTAFIGAPFFIFLMTSRGDSF